MFIIQICIVYATVAALQFYPLLGSPSLLKPLPLSFFAEDADGNINIDRVLVMYDREAMAYEVYRFINKDAHDEKEVKEYASFVGMTCAQRMLLFRK